MKRSYIPLAIFGVLVVVLGIGLTLNPREVPSPYIGKPAPDFTLPNLHNPQAVLTPAQMKGQVWLLNVWASWCVSCRAEHEVVKEVAKSNQVAIIGLNYKDEGVDALAWLKRYGDPYTAIAVDRQGDTGIDWGVYGVPETFVVDKKGIIRYKQIGPITEQAWTETLLPLIKQLQGEAS